MNRIGKRTCPLAFCALLADGLAKTLQPPPPDGEGRIFVMSRLGVVFVGGEGEGSLRGVLVWGYRHGEVPHGHGQEPRVPRDCF